MEFNKLIETQLFPIFQKCGFEIVEELKNIIRFESSIVKVNIVFNSYDRVYFVEIGKRNGILYLELLTLGGHKLFRPHI